MKKMFIALYACALALVVISCKKGVTGSGPIITESRTVSGTFNEIDLQIAGDVYYRKDTARKIEISAQKNIADMIETFVSNNRLIIKFKSSNDYRESDQIRINVSAPLIQNFVTSTSGNIYGVNAIKASEIYLRTSGSGSISLANINANSLQAYSRGSGSVTITSGTIVSGKLETVASGKIDLTGLQASSIQARTEGSGSIRASVSEHLDARIYGSGSIYYRGNPSLSTSIYGTGRLIKF